MKGTGRAATRQDGRSRGLSQRGPTAVRMLVGVQLRRLREACGISRADAGKAIGASASKMGHLERGRSGFKQRDVAALLTLYGIYDETDREALLDLVKQDSMPGWWADYSDVVPGRFEPFLGLELAASVIRCYEVEFIPGLLQTERYAEAVIRLAHDDDSADQIERRVRLRMRRRQILERADPPLLWAVIDEAAVRRPVGGRATHRAQLRHLIEVIELPHVTVQVMPSHVADDVAAGGSITILRFPEEQLPDVVYLEHISRALYLDKPTDVEHHWDIMNRVAVQAEPASATRSILYRILDDS
ncbi:MAG TPA: helix-turn-helix transcriptional regulator [Streptosporangiaceae bacterium]|nr:helix-turn-helix transcriptional regulator [Streptosporangiaceae bacterium]